MTTMNDEAFRQLQYLTSPERYVDESDELIQRAFESWSDDTRDYASYVLDELELEAQSS